MCIKITETHRVTIRTTYYGPTNHRGSRIKADAGMGRKVWVSYYADYDGTAAARKAGSYGDPHDIAALTLMDKMEWSNDLIKGATETGNVYVMVPSVSGAA